MKNIISVFLLLIVLFQSNANAQEPMANALKNKFDEYLQNNFQEKIYVHTDKDNYLAGEIIWFKIYNTDAYTNRPVNVSKVVYLEVLNAQNTPILQSKIALKDGRGEGSLYVPVTIPSGAYVLRAYTNWMKNFNADYYFHKNLSVYNTLKEENLEKAIKSPKSYAIQFFPEGGNLVSGLTSKIAFKAIDNQGKSFPFTANILNTQGDTLAKFNAAKFGLGCFYFTPKKAQAYHVLVTPLNGKPFTVSLPPVFEKGTVIAVRKEEDHLTVSLQNNLEQNGVFTLFVHSGQQTVFLKSLNAIDSKDGFMIPISILGDGISHLTLFGPDGNALCERLFFKKPTKLLDTEVKTDKKNYGAREAVQLQLSQSTSSGLPVQAQYSVSVYKADTVTSNEDIATNLWLTSELKGKIENANWYLNGASPDDVDLLMLTHGWRRFKWEDVVQKKSPQFKYLPEVDGHIITGKITNSVTNAPVANRIAFLTMPGRRYQFYTSSSNKDGRINFYTKNFYGGNEIIAQTDFRTDSLSHIEIDAPYSDKFSGSRIGKFNVAPNIQDLLNRSVAVQVNNAYLSKYLNKEIIGSSDSSFFYDRPDKVYKLDDYVRFTTMEEVLREYVPEIMVGLRKRNYHLNMFDPKINDFNNAAPFTLIDGVPVFDEGNTVIKTDPRKIERLEITAETYSYGRNIFPGILSLHSYKGDMAGYQLPKEALVVDYDGLQNSREFYSPMYNGDKEAFNRMPDYRTTLLWSPNNSTGTDGKSQLNFFTADIAGNYMIEVQALSKDGEAGTARTSFKVTENIASK